ncbi:phytoene desaturase family protein [Nocardia sp. NPDC056100]|uniref:phytoene desaturase family protein n=1 Tax=Nocardia sp. NPDC056100 TaxID=3345712 RepID=UPI0035DDDE6D
MRQVRGSTDHVVIVGAGLGGLAAALHLVAAGRRVTICEAEAIPGGRAGQWKRAGYRIDTGPAVLTMPELLSDALAGVGERLEDWLPLQRLDPAYRAFFADGSRLDIRDTSEGTEEEIRRVCGAREAAGYRRFERFSTRMYKYQFNSFIDRNYDSPLGALAPDLARLIAAGGLRKLAPKTASYFRDSRTRKIFTFQAMYAGLAPTEALALYSVISYMDCVAGVWFPTGGMHAVPQALAAVAEKHGVRIEYNTRISRVEMAGQRATAVITEAGERIAADVVVLNPDLPLAYRDLLGHEPARLRRLRYSPSCVLLLNGSTRAYPELAHHNIHFGTEWERTFHELMVQGKVPTDPSFFVARPTASDPALAPDGKSIYYVLFPVPNDTSGIDWQRRTASYREEIGRVLDARGYPGFDAAVEVEDVVTPQQWRERGFAAGTPFSAAHTFGQTGPFRPGNLYGENVVFTGCGTHPGVGVPMVLISGRLAADRIVGRTAARARRVVMQAEGSRA